MKLLISSNKSADYKYYSLAIAAAPFLIVLMGLWVSQTFWFVNHSGNTYLANLGWGATLEQANCDVVIYGDSSALVGLDPAIIQRRTGLSTCNISELAGMTMVNGWMIPDEYLRHNRNPRFMVFDFAPENLAPYTRWQTVSRFEAILFRIKSHRDVETLKLMASHPVELVIFASMALRVSLFGLARPPLPESSFQIRTATKGYLPIPGGPMEECPTDRREHVSDKDWIAELRQRYSKNGTTVIVDTTPEPSCDPTFDFYSNQHPATTDNTLLAYPLSDFNSSGRLHMNRSGTIRFSNYLSEQIISLSPKDKASK
jgi:hypothetical protein